MDSLRSTHLMTLTPEVAFAGIRVIGATAAGRRRIAPISGGGFEGERLRGRILPGGADWVLDRPDGAMLIDVRTVLETDDGALIYLQYQGAMRATPDVMQRLNRGEPIAESEYTLRITPRFETGHERYRWLNDVTAVGTGRRMPSGHPVYTIHEVA